MTERFRSNDMVIIYYGDDERPTDLQSIPEEEEELNLAGRGEGMSWLVSPTKASLQTIFARGMEPQSLINIDTLSPGTGETAVVLGVDLINSGFEGGDDLDLPPLAV
jgi:hypothetical protein